MAKTSYAKAAEMAASKRGKYEKKLEEALRTGDRFAINSAERSIARLTEYENQLYQSQEDHKAAKGIQNPQMPMAKYGGAMLPKYVTGGPLETDPLAGITNPNALMNLAPKTYTNLFGTAAPSLTPNLNIGPRPVGGAPLDTVSNEDLAQLNGLPFGQTELGKGLGAVKGFMPYAAQFAGDIYAMNQLKKLEKPAELPMQRMNQMSTDIDTSATLADIQNNRLATNVGLDTGLSNSASAANAKLAALAQTNQQVAGIRQQEANQELALRNQAGELATQNINANMGIAAQNQQNLADFNNMITNARLGLVQGMGTKAAQIKGEYNQMALDRERMDTLAKQFDSDLLARNFNNFEQYADLLYSDAATRDKAIAAYADDGLGYSQFLALEQSNPQLFNFLKPFVDNARSSK